MPQATITPDSQLQQRIQDVAKVAGYLWQKGWAEANAGNISVDVTEHIHNHSLNAVQNSKFELSRQYPELAGRFLLVSGSGTRMRDVAKNPPRNLCIIRISEQADSYQIVWGGGAAPNLRPTSELPSHLTIHQQFRRQGLSSKAIVHTHPDELVAITHIPEFADQEKLNTVLLSMHPETIIAHPGGVGLVSYTLPGTDDLARATIAALERRTTVIWQQHGCLATGADVFEAFDRIDTLVKAAHIFFLCKQAGYLPEGLTQAHLHDLRRKFLNEQ